MRKHQYLVVISLFLMLSALIISCRKDKLEGDYEILAGNWEWVESKGYCGTKYPNYCYYTPQSEGYTETIELLKKGKYIRYRNGEKVENGRIQINRRQEDLFSPWGFWLYLKKSEYETTTGYFKTQDTLLLVGYPYPIEEDVDNYFVRK